MHKMNFFLIMNIYISTILLILFCLPYKTHCKIITISTKGFDDGIRSNRQKDRNEAEINAMEKAVEKAGVRIQSETHVKNGILEYQSIISKVKSILLPGYKIHDMGYDENGNYQVVLIGQINTKQNFSERLMKKEVNLDDMIDPDTDIDIPPVIEFPPVTSDNFIKPSIKENVTNYEIPITKMKSNTNYKYNGTSFNIDDQGLSEIRPNWINRLRINQSK